MIANTPGAPYYAAISTSNNTENMGDYSEMAQRMVEKSGLQDGFLGVVSTRNAVGITAIRISEHLFEKSYLMNQIINRKK